MDSNENKVTKEQVIATAIPLIGTIGLEFATHSPEVLAFGLIGSLACGSLAPVARDIFVSAFVPDAGQAVNAAQQVLDALPIKDNSDLPQDPWSKMKRIAGIKDAEPAGQPKEEQRDNTATRRAVKSLPGKAGKASAVQPMIPAQFMLDEVLSEVRGIGRDGYVYFGRNAAGESVVISLADMYHVFDVCSSGSGKSNRQRLAMMQMVKHCETYYINPLANNIKPVKDERRIEVWTPIFERLANKKPMKTVGEIRLITKALIKTIAKRQQQEADGDFSWQDEPIFVFVDELAEIFALCPEAIEDLDRIGRIGRQYLVFCWVSSQTAAVEEIGQSTAAQAQYKTRLYSGGDRNSSNRLMKGSVSAEVEQALHSNGAGLSLMLAEGFDKPGFIRAPLVTNEALFAYLGEPPFDLAEWLPAKKTLPAMRQRNALDLSQGLSLPELPALSRNLSRNENEAPQAQNNDFEASQSNPRESRESVKGQNAPNIEVILKALNELADEEKTLTVNAIMQRTKLTWRQTEEIEEVAERYGFELVRGKGRPAK